MSQGPSNKAKQTRSCDLCRKRKRKCDLPPPSSHYMGPNVGSCSQCIAVGETCVFTYVQKKRGPRQQSMHIRPSTAFNPSSPPLLSPSENGSSASSSRQPPIESGPIDTSVTLPRLDSFVKFREKAHPCHNTPLPFPLSPESFAPGPSAINPIDRVLPRALTNSIVDLFFDYIYCLIPCIHKPSFYRDLHRRREELPGEEEWTALVLSVIATTLAQLPRSLVPIPRRDVRKVLLDCHSSVKQWQSMDFDHGSYTRIVINYLTAFTSRMLGFSTSGNMAFSANMALIHSLRLYDEKTYHSMNLLDMTMARRTFWLVYGADTSNSVIDNRPPIIAYDDVCDLTLPLHLDDEFVSEAALQQSSPGVTPLLSGFHYISKLFRMISFLLDMRSRDKTNLPSGSRLEDRLQDLQRLYSEVLTLMDGCPEDLRLRVVPRTFDVELFPDISDLVSTLIVHQDKNTMDKRHTMYLIQTANIYVTQQIARYLILNHKDHLLAAQSTQRLARLPLLSCSGIPTFDDYTSPEEKDDIIEDLMAILQQIPFEVLAVNSISLITKVRFMAATLLDVLSTSAATDVGPAQLLVDPSYERRERAQAWVYSFLTYLTEMEKLFSMTD